MADPANIIMHLIVKGDVERQRHLSRMQQLRNETAAFNMLKVATTLQGGAALNAMKGTLPFVLRNASRGMGTIAVSNPLAGHTIYTPRAAHAPAPSSGPPVKKQQLDPASTLEDALSVLSRAEVEAAWAVAETANKALGSTSIALRAEVASYLLATILDDIGRTTTRADDLSDVMATVETLALYVCGRMPVIVREIGSPQGSETLVH